jgi:putative toxin-antitoxin system antitoxin component (TIGR02293 family)
MKKTKNIKKIYAPAPHPKPNRVEDPEVSYENLRTMPLTKDLTFNDYKKMADKTPFTQAEWAAMLHVSERTLQRYAQKNSSFSFINAERFHQLMQVIDKGKKTLGSYEQFYNWLKSNPPSIDGDITPESLITFDGIQKVFNQLGRIEHGILA